MAESHAVTPIKEWNEIQERLAALEAENERLKVRVHQLLDCLEWVTNLYPSLEDGIEEKLKEAWPIRTYAQLAAPWTYLIDDKGRAVEGTLPEGRKGIVVSYYDTEKNYCRVQAAYYDDGWKNSETARPLPDWMAVYAWRERPTPAPYPGREEG